MSSYGERNLARTETETTGTRICAESSRLFRLINMHLQHQEGEQISNDKWIWKHVYPELNKH